MAAILGEGGVASGIELRHRVGALRPRPSTRRRTSGALLPRIVPARYASHLVAARDNQPMSTQGEFHPLFAPVESVKDQSLFKGQVITIALALGQPFYYWAWSRWYPEPYESITWRLICAALAVIAFIAIRTYGASDPRVGISYGLATAAGTVVLASWFFVANGGSSVWLASLAAMTIIYFSLTDWRVAIGVTLVSYAVSYLLVPALRVGVWATGTDYSPFNPSDWLVLGFCIAVSILTRYTDTSMRVVQLKSQLRALGIAAHEIRTPLAGMQLLSTALEERLDEAHQKEISLGDLETMRSLAKELRRSVQDANTLINTHLANANPFKPFSKREAVSVAAELHGAVSAFQRGAGSHEQLVHIQIRRDFTIQAEPGAIRQVIVNLLSNAQKAVVLRHLAVGAHQICALVDVDDAGRLVVADRGVGIPKHEISRVFEPFHTGDPLHGHGLGLTYVRAAVSAYGGSISIAENEHGGTSVTISFPEAVPT